MTLTEAEPVVTESAGDGESVRPQGPEARVPGAFGYLPALDGLRALAVALVVAYHLGYSGVAGGYVGVEVFFVLSGWLVCALLANEHRTTGRIDLRRFWLRRARRLLPAAVTAIVGTLAVATVLSPDRVAALRSDALAALGYHLNWRLILDHQSYFQAADGPSALEHLWSLSIEEQFYLVFPLACGLLLALGGGRRRVGPAVVLVLAGVAASTVWRLALYRPQVDPSRLYFGTDTRAAGLLAGVALGLVWVPGRFRPRRIGLVSAGLDLVGLAGVGTLAWYATAASEQRPTAFGLDFTLVQAATLGIIAAAVFPAPTLVGQALSARPLQWIGRRSYGIYLIHWPVIVFTARAPGQQPAPTAVVAAQVAGTVALAAISYRWIEQPVRRRGFLGAAGHAYRWLERPTRSRPQVATALAAGLMVLAGGTVVVGRTIVSASTPGEARAEAVVIGPGTAPGPAAAGVSSGQVAGGTIGTTGTTGTTATPEAPSPAPVLDAGAPLPPSPPAPAPPPVYAPTTAVGDSVMVGGAQALATRMGSALTLDAQVGRQMFEAPAIVRDLAGRGELAQVVLVHLGNNGPVSRTQIDELFAAIGPDRQVVLVTVFVPRRWEGEVNDALTAAVARHPNARLADWRSVAASEPGLTAGDGYHLNPAGAERYADVVTAALSH